MKVPYNCCTPARNHQQYIATAPDMGHILETNDCELNALAISKIVVVLRLPEEQSFISRGQSLCSSSS